MKVTSISNHEKTFFETGKDSSGKEFMLTEKIAPIKGSDQVMPYTYCSPKNKDVSFYYHEKNTKTQIVLHFTVGYLKGDIAALSRNNVHVSTPFVIARNGKIINLWSSAFWSYHLGKDAIGGNTNGSKRTIAIEISNIGFLKRIGDKLVTVYSNDDVYCHINDKQFYTKLDIPYRGEHYFATYTKKQYSSLLLLLRYLTSEYNIPRKFLPKNKRFVTGEQKELVNFKGIVSHVNYRASGKWDIGPAFDWEKIAKQDTLI